MKPTLHKMKPVRDFCTGEGVPGRFGPYKLLTAAPNLWPLLLTGKMHEEVEEIREDMTDVDEYADLLQLIVDLAAFNGITQGEIEHARLKKLGEKGGFTECKVLLRDRPDLEFG